MHLAVHVVQHRFHQRLAPGQEEVLGVGPPGPGRILTRLPLATLTPAMRT